MLKVDLVGNRRTRKAVPFRQNPKDEVEGLGGSAEEVLTAPTMTAYESIYSFFGRLLALFFKLGQLFLDEIRIPCRFFQHILSCGCVDTLYVKLPYLIQATFQCIDIKRCKCCVYLIINLGDSPVVCDLFGCLHKLFIQLSSILN